MLLIDVDPKVRPLSDQLGLGESQGFLDLVSDPSLRPEDMLRTTAIPNLTIMPVGTRLGGAAQTLGGTASTRPIIPTISRLARRFPKHLIMLDAPPCLSTSDPHTLAPHVGQVVLVVEAERTQAVGGRGGDRAGARLPDDHHAAEQGAHDDQPYVRGL